MMLTAIWAVIKAVTGPATELLKGWQTRKQAALESELALAKAKTEAQIKYLDTQQAADIAWENLSIGNSGWKDEFWTLVLAIPAVLCFIPGMDVYVFRGFEALKNCPDYYNWMLSIAVGSAFGFKKIADFMALKKGA